MAAFFGGKDPFDHPFFTQPFGGMFGGRSPFDDPFFSSSSGNQSGSSRRITIEELNPHGDGGNDVSRDCAPKKELSMKDQNRDNRGGFEKFSFQRVAFGGPDGIYYSSSVGKRTGDDGVFLMEMKEEDQMVGESLHTVSKGIHNKGHSMTRRNHCDGQVDSLQTLHNLNEDELAGFEETWQSSADKAFPGWNNGFNFLSNAGWEKNLIDDFANWTGFDGWAPVPSLEYFGYGGMQPNGQTSGLASKRTTRKVIPIE